MMGKPHKDLAQFLVAAADEADKTDAQVAKVRFPPVRNFSGCADNSFCSAVQLLAQRVQGLLQQLQTLIPEGKHAMSVADIKAKEMPAALQRFMWNLAVAENLAEL